MMDITNYARVFRTQKVFFYQKKSEKFYPKNDYKWRLKTKRQLKERLLQSGFLNMWVEIYISYIISSHLKYDLSH